MQAFIVLAVTSSYTQGPFDVLLDLKSESAGCGLASSSRQTPGIPAEGAPLIWSAAVWMSAPSISAERESPHAPFRFHTSVCIR